MPDKSEVFSLPSLTSFAFSKPTGVRTWSYHQEHRERVGIKRETMVIAFLGESRNPTVVFILKILNIKCGCAFKYRKRCWKWCCQEEAQQPFYQNAISVVHNPGSRYIATLTPQITINQWITDGKWQENIIGYRLLRWSPFNIYASLPPSVSCSDEVPCNFCCQLLRLAFFVGFLLFPFANACLFFSTS